MSPLSLALLLFAFPPPDGTATVDYDRWSDLADLDEVPAPLPAPWAAKRTVEVTEDREGFSIRAQWRIDALREDWFSDTLIGPGVEVRDLKITWNGKPAAATTDESGTRVAGLVGPGGATVIVTGHVDQAFGQRPVMLELAPAVRGTMEVRPRSADVRGELRETPARVPARYAKSVSKPGEAALFASSAQYLELDVGRGEPADETTVSVATVATGLTVDDAELRGQARVRLDVRRGSVTSASLRVSGLGADLQVSGDNVVNWTQSGDRIDLELEREVEDRLVVDLRWSTSVPKGTEASLAVPTVEVDGAFRSVQAVALARTNEVELVPELEGILAVPRSELEGRADGLVEGTPSATFLGQAAPSGTVKLLRFVPAKQPPTFIDRANYTIATTREGRALVRAVYQVRNERSSHLHVTPPKGMTIIGARVSGETALLAKDRRDKSTYLIPLERSVETVDGLISFPVEVTFLVEDKDWNKREKRTFTLPTLDAPVAASRVTLHLPPRYRNKQKTGRGGTVSSFDDGKGIAYGFGYGTPEAVEADGLFRGAVSAWLDNDFDNAQAKLDELRSLGASDENIARLQSNVDVVTGKSEGKGKDQALVRRVKQQAQARSADERREQEVYARKAEEYRKSGQLEEAKAAYGSALALGKKLQALEQTESVEQSSANAVVEEKLKAVDKEIDLKADRESSEFRVKRQNDPRKPKPSNSRDRAFEQGITLGGADEGSQNVPVQGADQHAGPLPDANGVTVYDFEDDTLDGELLRPEGANIESRATVPESKTEPEQAGACWGDAACPSGSICIDGACVEGSVSYGSLGAGEAAILPEGGVVGGELGGVVGGDLGVEGDAEELIVLEDETEKTGEAPPPAPPSDLDDADEDEPMMAPTVERDSISALSRLPGVSRGGRSRRSKRSRKKKKRRGAKNAGAAPMAPEPEDLPQPKVSASALSVIVPAIGQTVLYERLLLPRDEPMTIEIDAKFDPPPRRLQ